MKGVAWLVVPPLAALAWVFFFWAPLSASSLASSDPPSLQAPPDAACEALLHHSLEQTQAGVSAVSEFVASTPSREALQQRSEELTKDDAEWRSLARRSSFVDAFLNAPPGVPPRELHRCGDLNPDDIYIPPETRRAIELALEPYYRALEEARRQRDRAFSDEMDEARRSGLATISSVETRKGDPVSLTLQPTAERTLSSVAVDEMGRAESTTVSIGRMPRFAYLDSVHWFVARDAGTQIISIFACLKCIPSDHADLLTARIVGACARKIH